MGVSGRARLGWAVPGGSVGEGWHLGCHGCLWRGGLAVGGLLGCSGGVFEAFGHRWGACVSHGLVDFWLLHGMVMDETQHVFPGGGVGELSCVCQQERFPVYDLGRCSADCF